MKDLIAISFMRDQALFWQERAGTRANEEYLHCITNAQHCTDIAEMLDQRMHARPHRIAPLGLTILQGRAYRFIQSFIRENLLAPSFQEIGRRPEPFLQIRGSPAPARLT